MLVSLDFFKSIVDRIVDDVKTLKSNIQSLQPKINGVQGQVVGFDNDGNAIATAETDPTVPGWAKQAQKPAYTAKEVGAAATTHTHTQDDLILTDTSTGIQYKLVVTDGNLSITAYSET